MAKDYRIYKRGYSFVVRIGEKKWEIVNSYRNQVETVLEKLATSYGLKTRIKERK